MTKALQAYTTLFTQTHLALGSKRTLYLCSIVDKGLHTTGTTKQIQKTVAKILTTTDTAQTDRVVAALNGTSALVLESLAETWRPRTIPTSADIFYQVKDVQCRISDTIRLIRYTLNKTTTMLVA